MNLKQKNWCSLKQELMCLVLSTQRYLVLSRQTLREKCPNSEFFWSVFSRIRTKYGKIRTRKTLKIRTLVTQWEFGVLDIELAFTLKQKYPQPSLKLKTHRHTHKGLTHTHKMQKNVFGWFLWRTPVYITVYQNWPISYHWTLTIPPEKTWVLLP